MTHQQEEIDLLVNLVAERQRAVESLTEQLAESHQISLALTEHVAERQTAVDLLAERLSERHEKVLAFTEQVAERQRAVDWLALQLTDRQKKLEALTAELVARNRAEELLRSSLVEKEQAIRLLECRVVNDEQIIDSLATRVREKEQQLAKIANSLGGRLLALYGRVKYPYLLFLYRLCDDLKYFVTHSRLQLKSTVPEVAETKKVIEPQSVPGNQPSFCSQPECLISDHTVATVPATASGSTERGRVKGQVIKTSVLTSDAKNSKLGIYLPSSYVKGRPQKWFIYCHGGGGWPDKNQWYYVTDQRWQSLCETYGLIMVAGDGDLNSEDSWVHAWMSLDNRTPNTHLEEFKNNVRESYELDFYLPCILGTSMGGYKTILEMCEHPESYSAFAASCPMVSAIQWQKDSEAGLTPHVGWKVTMGGDLPPSADPKVDARWVKHSPTKTIESADFKGRKLWVAWGTEDETLLYSTMGRDFYRKLPAIATYKKYTLTGKAHEELWWHENYLDEIMKFFVSETRPAG